MTDFSRSGFRVKVHQQINREKTSLTQHLQVWFSLLLINNLHHDFLINGQ